MATANQYLATLGPWGSWVPAVTPADVPAVVGFNLAAESLPGQLDAAEYLAEAAAAIWAPLGAQASDVLDAAEGLVDGITQASQVQAIAAWGVRLAQGAQVAVEAFEQLSAQWGYVTAWADFVGGLVTGTIEGNQGRRRGARLAAMRDLQEAGPNQWAGGLFLQRKYTFVDTDLKERWCSSWPNTRGPSQLQYSNEANISTGCAGGITGQCDVLACTREGENQVMVFPLFFPLWSQLAAGGGMKKSLTRGMRETPDAGALIWRRCAAMQQALLTDPVFNLQLDARKVRKRIEHLRTYFAQNAAGPIDAAFKPGKYSGMYWTPSGQVGLYTPQGAVLVDSYEQPATTQQTSANCWGQPYKLHAAEVNAAVAAAGQFFALRSAIVRSPYMLETIAAETDMLGTRITPSPAGGIIAEPWIPEPEVRALVANPDQAGTPQLAPPGGTGGGGFAGGFATEIAQAPGAIQPPPFSPIGPPSRLSPAAAAAAVGVGLVLWALL
jgi:hypothetical protein